MTQSDPSRVKWLFISCWCESMSGNIKREETWFYVGPDSVGQVYTGTYTITRAEDQLHPDNERAWHPLYNWIVVPLGDCR